MKNVLFVNGTTVHRDFLSLALVFVSHPQNIIMPAVGSQICAERVSKRNYDQHRARLASIKAHVDNQPPPMYPHLYQKLKKAQLEEERCSDIERDNRTLVKRMTGIMQRSGIDSHAANSSHNSNMASLNQVKRKQELAKITRENHALMKRIQESQPTYSHLQWEQDRERNEQMCERLCKYPYRPGASQGGEHGGSMNGGSPRRPESSPAAAQSSPPQQQQQQHNDNSLPPIENNRPASQK